ncbi:hypothetical protein FOA43_001520 [Brettanomyces nanus]|uniref:aminodeoxychorismate synthase n=1 Tax=Eeniella nana TaxID=13502 RepID=A0A875RYH2_EENNA|nr:uncharacterized protein FOA43_001520 [Brettanomyces nanus]QPG74196.1 hypothetical protein FOA43_001520 [Brettanomyces nanus]
MGILLVDSYDSFTFSLENLLETATGIKVFTIRNDSFSLPKDKKLLDDILDSVQAVVIGPGPGSPQNPDDVGIIPYIFEKKDLPILGICLGFQCLSLKYGCTMKYLNDPVHGQVHAIHLCTPIDALFESIPDDFKSVRYHSIYIDGAFDTDVVPLAFSSDCDSAKKPILMAAKHKKFPHYGVQYHPESICSEYGDQLIKNFWKIAQTVRPEASSDHNSIPRAISYQPLIPRVDNINNRFLYQYKKLNVSLDTITICDNLSPDFLLLNSAANPGNWSIIGIPIKEMSDVLTHSTENPSILRTSTWGNKDFEETCLTHNESIWTYLSSYMAERFFKPCIDDSSLRKCPFVGGLVGFLSYEEGKYVNINRLKKITESDIPDTKMCFIERFIAIERETQHCYVVSIRPDDRKWIEATSHVLESVTSTLIQPKMIEKIRIELPIKQTYFRKFAACQKYLRSGDSYELCLTTTTKVHIARKDLSYWKLYKNMILKNASPYSVFMDFGDAQVLSTSPERFIYWDHKRCQMRPIKGTVKKTEKTGYASACQELLIPKEMGENLMIVDLIRHDLYTLLKDVKVSKLMGVEEYQTVYQLVSVIEGDLESSPYRGIDLLHLALPPGSMTGAPKKRSVELLQEIEDDNRRGIYSGVVGYWSVNDTADWSVIIRTLYSYKDDLEDTKDTKCMRCGAGGAITVLSTAEGEWKEMNIKMDSTLQVFD